MFKFNDLGNLKSFVRIGDGASGLVYAFMYSVKYGHRSLKAHSVLKSSKENTKLTIYRNSYVRCFGAFLPIFGAL